ncbi:MAG: hypothetical protein ACQEWF_08020 [Bacillota bacterium]|jgi:hypothetical protein
MGCFRDRDDVFGAFDRDRDRDDFRVPVRAFIRGEDFCRAVRRCDRDDVRGIEDRRRRRRCCWF